MPATQSVLSYDVFTAPEKPFAGPPPAAGDALAWDPTTSTLIFGARDAVLVDPLMTIAEATALAGWVGLHDRRLTTVYITHGHGDHYLGLPVVLDRFPVARPVATAGTVLETAHTDTVDTTSLHVPDLGLIVSGDVAYNHCHMYVGDTTPDSRAEWTSGLDRLAAVNPTAVVAGHKDPTQGNPPAILGESRGYLEYYGQLRDEGLPDHQLFDSMVKRYPSWVSRQQFLILGLN